MEQQQPRVAPDLGTASNPPAEPKHQIKARAAEPTRRRERPAGQTPGFATWVDSKRRSDFGSEASPSSTTSVVATPAINAGAVSEIRACIDRNYKVQIDHVAEVTSITGELDLIEWPKFEEIIEGLNCVVAGVLGIARDKIINSTNLAAKPNGTAQPSFVLKVPRPVTDLEQDALNEAYAAFNQRLRGQDDSLNKDMFADANPSAVEVGRRAAEAVRRRAGGRSLPQALKVGLGSEKEVTLQGRIGDHPDPEVDQEPISLTGKVVTIRSEEHNFEIRCFKYKGQEGREISSRSGKKFTINYSDKEQREDVLRLPLGRSTMLTFSVVPRVGRSKDKLILRKIDDVQTLQESPGKSSTTS